MLENVFTLDCSRKYPRTGKKKILLLGDWERDVIVMNVIVKNKKTRQPEGCVCLRMCLFRLKSGKVNDMHW